MRLVCLSYPIFAIEVPLLWRLRYRSGLSLSRCSSLPGAIRPDELSIKDFKLQTGAIWLPMNPEGCNSSPNTVLHQVPESSARSISGSRVTDTSQLPVWKRGSLFSNSQVTNSGALPEVSIISVLSGRVERYSYLYLAVEPFGKFSVYIQSEPSLLMGQAGAFFPPNSNSKLTDYD